MTYAKVLSSLVLSGGLLASTMALAESGQITPALQGIAVMHNGKTVTITRSTDPNAQVPEAYLKTARSCPPFCIQPMQVAAGVETVGELEVLGYLKRISNGDRKVMVVDSRTPDWVSRGTIPGSVNIPWDRINVDVGGTFEIEAEADTMNQILVDQFGARLENGKWDFRNAKTLVLYCNGIWCPQSSVNIKTLTKLGYPTYKLKWYRGGMQSWVSVGLTTVTN